MQIRVYYEDTDCGNMVYHSNYFKFCERARSELFFKKSLLPHNEEYFFVVKSCEANWVKSAFFADILEVKTEILEKKAASIIMEQKIFRKDELIFEAKFKLAFLRSGKVAKIPEEIFKILED